MQAVSTTAVANAEEKSTLGANAMHATMPLKKASFTGRGRWDAIPCGRDRGPLAFARPCLNSVPTELIRVKVGNVLLGGLTGVGRHCNIAQR